MFEQETSRSAGSSNSSKAQCQNKKDTNKTINTGQDPLQEDNNKSGLKDVTPPQGEANQEGTTTKDNVKQEEISKRDTRQRNAKQELSVTQEDKKKEVPVPQGDKKSEVSKQGVPQRDKKQEISLRSKKEEKPEENKKQETLESKNQNAPAENKKVTPADNKKLTPAENKKETPADTKKVTPADKKVTPADNKKVTPADNKKVTPADSKKETPADTKKITLAENKIVTPAENKKAPAENKKVAPSENKKQETPAESKKVTPAENKTITPAENKEGKAPANKTQETAPEKKQQATPLENKKITETENTGTKQTTTPEDKKREVPQINKQQEAQKKDRKEEVSQGDQAEEDNKQLKKEEISGDNKKQQKNQEISGSEQEKKQETQNEDKKEDLTQGDQKEEDKAQQKEDRKENLLISQQKKQELSGDQNKESKKQVLSRQENQEISKDQEKEDKKQQKNQEVSGDNQKKESKKEGTLQLEKKQGTSKAEDSQNSEEGESQEDTNIRNQGATRSTTPEKDTGKEEETETKKGVSQLGAGEQKECDATKSDLLSASQSNPIDTRQNPQPDTKKTSTQDAKQSATQNTKQGATQVSKQSNLQDTKQSNITTSDTKQINTQDSKQSTTLTPSTKLNTTQDTKRSTTEDPVQINTQEINQNSAPTPDTKQKGTVTQDTKQKNTPDTKQSTVQDTEQTISQVTKQISDQESTTKDIKENTRQTDIPVKTSDVESKPDDSSEVAPPSQCGPVLSTCDSGMGNTLFSSPDKCDSEIGDRKDGSGCDCVKQDSAEGKTKVCVSCIKGTSLSNLKRCKSDEDGSISGEVSHLTAFKRARIQRFEVKDCPSSSVDEGIELHDSSDALENSGEEDNEKCSKPCDKGIVPVGDASRAFGKEKDFENALAFRDANKVQLKSSDVPEIQEFELSARCDGNEVPVLQCFEKEQLNPILGRASIHSIPKTDCQSVSKNILLGANSLCADGNLGLGGCNLVGVNRNLVTDNCNINLEGCSVGIQGCSASGDCYAPGDNLMCHDDPMRDTDSEAGDSCCSDEEHGEACRGENGCVHRGGADPLDQNWDYVVDEEYNVPRKPIFNGSSDQLERRSSLKRKASEEPEEIKPAKCKRGIQFEGVTVFYFPRSQGFTCVPSQGGSSLGMSRRHSHIRQFSLAEHAVEQRRAHREYLLRLRQQRSAREHGESSSRGSSSEDSEENSEEASDLSDSELDADSYYFLQPLPIRQRRALLRQAGICHIEGLEKEECKDIRISREMCGCQCKVYCDPDTCQCAQAGIKCQVDRHNFPCGCSREGCGNAFGRIEFNPIRVRTHFIHTLMRLEIEKRQTQQHHHHQQQQQQQQEWHQQRAKWLAASSSVPTNGFTGGGGGSGLGTGNLPFFDATRDPGASLSVADINKFNPSVEMGACVGSMNTPLYPHFESRQMLGPGSSVYIQHGQSHSVGDYNSGTCSVFGGLGAPFDPSSAYGSCHGFPSASVVPGPPQVAPSQTGPPEAYNTLTKFANTTNSLVSASFPYSTGVSPAATPTIPAVNCSYPQNNFCMTAVHDNTNGSVFGQYHDASTVTQNLFKATMNECNDFQPNFEALSSSASSDKGDRYIPAPTLVHQDKDMCGGDGGGYSAEASVSNQCTGVVDNIYKVTAANSSCSSTPSLHGNSSCSTSSTTSLHLPNSTTSSLHGNLSCSTSSNPHGSSSCSTTSSLHNNLYSTNSTVALHHHPSPGSSNLRLPQLPMVSTAPPPLLNYDHSTTTSTKDTPPTDDTTDVAENLGQIVKKSRVETVSA